MNAVAEKDGCEARKLKAGKQLASQSKVKEDLQQNKFNISVSFRSPESRQSYQHELENKIASGEGDVENWEMIR